MRDLETTLKLIYASLSNYCVACSEGVPEKCDGMGCGGEEWFIDLATKLLNETRFVS